MEKLQWFKFTPSDWMMGKIQRCPEITQARFLRLCCLYWNKECELSKEDAIIEIDKEHFDCLESKKIISCIDNVINISFLDEQFLEIQEVKDGKSKSGLIGNLKRWHPAIYAKFKSKKISLEDAIKESQTVAKQSHTDSTPIADQSQNIADKKREDKIRLDKIKEDNSNANKLAEGVVEYFNGVCVNLPKVVKLTDKRKKHILARLKEHSKEDIKKVIDLTAESNFLNGKNTNGWTASFDWIIDKSNFIKILENNYINKQNGKDRRQISVEDFNESIERHFR